jgi:hypothetical protein
VEVQSTPAKPDKINAGAFLFYAAGSDIFCSFSITYNLEGFYSGGLGSRRYTGKTLGFTNVLRLTWCRKPYQSEEELAQRPAT